MSWQRISGFILCVLLLSAAACGGQEQDDNTDDDRALQESDLYQLQIEGDHAPAIENDTLTFTASYSGGCETHDFTLVTDGIFLESDPVQLDVTLMHDANNDLCEAYLTRPHVVDLTFIKTLYQEAYGTNEGSIILHMRHLATSEYLPLSTSLRYDF